MVAVANIRINTQVPFPAMVVGSGPITVAKTVGGVWTVGANGRIINTANPGLVATDYVLVWDDLAQAWLKISLPNLITQASQVRTQRSVTSSPITVGPTDQILNVNISTGSPACTLPQASSRSGMPVTFKDVGGNFQNHNLTITAFAGDTIDGLGTFLCGVNREAVTLVPFNDGTNVGWAIE